MKQSNVLLGLWVLLVAGAAMVLVWYLRTGDTPGGATPGGTPPVAVVPPKELPAKPPRPPRPGRAGDPKEPRAAPVVTGRVVNGVGEPVPGAVVRLCPPTRIAPAADAAAEPSEARKIAHTVSVFDDDWERLRSLASWSDAPPVDAERGAGATLGESVSGADGAFRFELSPNGGKGPFRLSVRVDSVGSASAANVFAGQEVELVLSSGGVVTGTVTGESDGALVPAAKVVFDSGDREYTASTDDAGAFRVESMPPGRYTVRAGAKGRTPILDQTVQVVRGEPVKLVLPRGITMRLKTVLADAEGVAETGNPLPGVDVVALEENTLVYVTGRTNDYGLLELTGLPPGSWVVNGRAEKFVSQGETVVRLEANKPIVDEEISFEAAVPTPIEVVDDTGAPVPGVEFYSADGMDGYDVLRSEKLPGATDADGKWAFPFEFDGPRCMVFGFKKGWGVVHAFPDDYSSGETLKLVMRRSVRVFGRVRDSAGAAAPDAIVRFTIDPGETSESGEVIMAQIRADVTGRYEFDFVPEGWEVSLEAETEDGWSDDMPTVEIVPGRRDYEVDLTIEATPADPVVRSGGGEPLPPEKTEKPK